MANPLKSLWGKLSGWKTMLAYLLMQFPFFSGNPMLLGAFQAMMADPNKQTASTFAVQLLLAVGVAHKVIKNLDALSRGSSPS